MNNDTIFQNLMGVYCNASEKITKLLNVQYLSIAKKNKQIPVEREKLKFPEEKIKVKLSGDGTSVANNNIFNICVCFPDFVGCNSAHGNYSLGIFEIEKENYENLEIALKEILDNLKVFKQLDITGGA